MKKSVLTLAFAFSLAAVHATAQSAPATDGDHLLQQTLQRSALAYGGKPFHAVLEIAPGKADNKSPLGPGYTGRVEVWWESEKQYRAALASPGFTLERKVNGDIIEEKHTGDYFPVWLDAFLRALVDPIPVSLFNSSAGAIFLPKSNSGGYSTQNCIRRDDRINGITDQLTWGQLCFDLTQPVIADVITFNYFMEFSDWRTFEKQQIPRTYQTSVMAFQPIVAKMTTLEALSAADNTLIKTATTSSSDLMKTAFVSTATEESMVEKAPNIQWPSVHEGKTEGYMIVYARTDKTGQVRESNKHNSDNAELESFGIEQALNYKFKPLLLNGAPVQMEMPLVLHFNSRVENPTPMLSLDEMKKQTIRCKPDSLPPGVLASGQHAIVTVTVDEKGHVSTTKPNSTAPWGRIVTSWMSVKNCQFRPYLVNGKPTVYKGDIELPR